MKKAWCVVPMLVAMTGCSMFTSDKPFPLEETQPDLVEKCRPVGKYFGPVGYRLYGPPEAHGPFKLEAAEKAKAEGATHIYWRYTGMGMSGRLTGFAVDCTGVDVGKPSGEEDWE